MEKFSRFKSLIVLIFLMILSIVAESPFQKGGVDNYMHYIIFFITILVSLFYLFPYPYPKFIVIEKIIYSIISAFLGLAISLVVTDSVLELLYGIDYQLKSRNFILNVIFYLITNIISIGLLNIILKMKYRGTDSQQRN